MKRYIAAFGLLLLLTQHSFADPVWCQGDGASITGGCIAPKQPAPNPATGWSQYDSDGSAYATFLARPQSRYVSAGTFFDKFRVDEDVLEVRAEQSNPAIGVGLRHGLAAGTINLTGCPTACEDTALKAWMDALVAASVITTDREAEILTP